MCVFGPSGQPLRIVQNVNDNMNLINMFQGFQNVQFVKLHSDTIKVLTLVPGLLEKQPSPFTNLKSLKLYSGYNSKLPRIPFHVMHYLLGDSASDDFEIVKLEDVQVIL
ncbi:hypothetical protein GH714_016613 [Hevea brasiliensis]|uniref:FBD domain-containing protein n=1 Tax=Hevea brasiliensis TaxID=3981 RepID=A0A6A6L526_HEVBR|nr:hypothetical protein GH714_016613 [Hevea brasiliensis]